MAFSKNLWFLVALSTALLSGCKFEHETQSESDSFVVDLITLEGAPRAQPVSSHWPFLKYKTYNVRICPRDATNLNAIPGEPFALKLPGFEKVLSGEAPDCRIAPYPVTYNELAPENNITVDATLVGLGRYQGSQSLKLAINPWLDQLVDLRYAPGFATVNAEEATEAFLGQGRFRPELSFEQSPKNHAGNLYLETAQLSFLHVSSTTTQSQYRVRFVGKPMFRRKRVDGEWHREAVSRGQYKLKLVAAETADGEKNEKVPSAIASAESANVLVTADGTIVEKNLLLTVNRAQTPGSSLVWYVLLEPLQPEPGLMSFLGTAPAERLLLGDSLLLSLGETDLAALPSSLPAVATRESIPPQDEKFRASALGFKFKGAPEFSPHPDAITLNPGTQRAKLKANVEFCLVRSVGEDAVAHQPIQLSLHSLVDHAAAPAVLSLTTDDQGCTHSKAPFEIEFDYYAPVNFLQFRLEVSSNTAPFADTKNTALVYLNPWQREARNFYWNNQKGQPPVNPLADRPAELLVANLSTSYTDAHESFSLDRQMNLYRHGRIRLKMEPVAFRPYVFGVEKGPSEQREGLAVGTKLKLRVLFAGRHHEKDLARGPIPPEQLRYINGFEKEVTVQKGGENERNFILEDVDLVHEFSEQILFKSSFSLFFELSPLAAGSQLAATPLVAEFDPTERHEALTVLNSPFSLDQLTQGMMPDKVSEHIKLATLSENPLVLKPKRVDLISPYQDFLQTVRPAPVENLVDLSQKEIAWPASFPEPLRQAEAFNRFLEDARDRYLLPNIKDWDVDSVFRMFAKRFCSIYAEKNLDDCVTHDPYKYVEFQLLEFVEAVNTPPKRLALPAKTFDRNRLEFRVRFFKEKIHSLRVVTGDNNSENHEKGWAGHFGAEALVVGASVSRGVTYRNAHFWASETNDTADLKDRYEVMQAKLLNVLETRLSLDLKVKSCLWVRSAKMNPAQEPSAPFLICTAPRDRSFEESWYSIIGSMDFQGEGQMARDTQDPDNRFVKLIRGSYLFREFFRVMGSRTKNLRLDSLGSATFGPTHLLNEVYRTHQGPYSRYEKAGGMFPGISRYRVIPNPR